MLEKPNISKPDKYNQQRLSQSQENSINFAAAAVKRENKELKKSRFCRIENLCSIVIDFFKSF